MRRSASEILRNLEMRIARLERQAGSSSNLRTIKSILRREGLLNQVELSGRGTDWEIEAPNEKVADKVRDALRVKGILTGGYTTGYGGEIIKPSHNVQLDNFDWNHPGSRHHY